MLVAPISLSPRCWAYLVVFLPSLSGCIHSALSVTYVMAPASLQEAVRYTSPSCNSASAIVEVPPLLTRRARAVAVYFVSQVVRMSSPTRHKRKQT